MYCDNFDISIFVFVINILHVIVVIQILFDILIVFIHQRLR